MGECHERGIFAAADWQPRCHGASGRLAPNPPARQRKPGPCSTTPLLALKANAATALAAFNDKSNTKFRDRDLYAFCYDMTDGKFTAHANPAMMGTDVRALKAKDDPLGQRISSTRSTNHQEELSSR